jgi:hypothetical protein
VRSPLVPNVSGSTVQLLVLAYQRFISRAHTVRRRRVDSKLCLRTNVWVATGQALVAAITGEADRLISLDLSSLGDGSQLPGRAAITNYGQGSTLAHIKTPHTHRQEIHVWAKIMPHMRLHDYDE